MGLDMPSDFFENYFASITRAFSAISNIFLDILIFVELDDASMMTFLFGVVSCLTLTMTESINGDWRIHNRL